MFAFGIHMQSLEVITTNSNWVKSFVDRSLESKKKDPLYKLLRVHNFNIFWNCDFKIDKNYL